MAAQRAAARCVTSIFEEPKKSPGKLSARNLLILLAGGLGFEPRQAESESDFLTNHEIP